MNQRLFENDEDDRESINDNEMQLRDEDKIFTSIGDFMIHARCLGLDELTVGQLHEN
jgi:hypothetical protein